MEQKFYEKFKKKDKKEKQGKKDIKRKNITSETSQPQKEKNPSSDNNNLKQKTPNHHNSKDAKKSSYPKKEQSLFTTDKITKDSDYILQHFDEVVQGVRPLNSKQLQKLPENIKALSHQLTDNRSERRLGYMNDNIQLSSYVRYYTWWNLVRLTRLFSNLPATTFPQKDGVCMDLGTGPLTVINALWLARPELRKLKLTWYCLDVSSNSMALGEDIYISIAARTAVEKDSNEKDIEPWNIIRIKGSFGTQIKKKADFITCANMFNELDQAGDMPPEYQSKKYFQQLQTYGKTDCKFLLIEPGVPKATRTLTLLRERFISAGKIINAPCPHHLSCPMNGFKAYTGSTNKWCNFCFSTDDAPTNLLKLSEQAKLPKERATLIFISAINNINSENKTAFSKSEKGLRTITCRITSDPFRLPEHKIGYYGCSELGLTLVKTNGTVEKNPNAKQKGVISNEKAFIIKGPLASGDLISVKVKEDENQRQTDKKTGAVMIDF